METSLQAIMGYHRAVPWSASRIRSKKIVSKVALILLTGIYICDLSTKPGSFSFEFQYFVKLTRMHFGVKVNSC